MFPCQGGDVVHDATPPSRRPFQPAPDKTGPTDWRTALRHRGPRCGIGLAFTLALISTALLRSSVYFGLGIALGVLAIPWLIAIVVRQNRQQRSARVAGRPSE